ncbi:uncharacterized protein [Oryza sativa Japonica Group]|uniref:uncharacterized protein n=1 Tax=Oryza sativa subsp. japonica TaxID=39947 RepID=UPI00339D1455
MAFEKGKRVRVVEKNEESPPHESDSAYPDSDLHGAAPKMKWSEQRIEFSAEDHPKTSVIPGRYPIVVKPTIRNVKVARVLINGGSSINLLFASTLDAMGVPQTYSAIIGRTALAKFMACDKRSLDMVEQMPTPPATSEPPKKVSKLNKTPKPDGAIKIVPLSIANPDKTPSDMPGVPREVIEHKLMVRPDAKPMPFGLITAGNTFQRTVQGALSNQLGNNVEAYVDDIVVKTKTSDSLIDDLRETFDNPRRYRLMLNPEKCTFGVPSGKLLGFLVSGRGIEANPEKIKAIENMKSPTRLKEVQKLTGSIKSHVLADFVADWTIPDNKSDSQGENETWTMAFDGALNSQGAGAGFILTSPSGDQFKHAIHLNFRATNNTAEYEGLLAGIRAAAALGAKRLIIKGDSELVANQVHKDYKCSNPELSKYLSEVRKLERRFDGIEVRHVYRKDNVEPDDLARRASRREPLEPGTFLDVLTKPSVKEVSGEVGPSTPDISSEVTEAECEVADIETTDDWRSPLIKFIGSEELPEDDTEAEKITRKAKIYCMIGNDLYKKSAKWDISQMRLYRRRQTTPPRHT